MLSVEVPPSPGIPLGPDRCVGLGPNAFTGRVTVGASSSQAPTQEQVVQMFRGSMTTWGDGTTVQIVDRPSTPMGGETYTQVRGQSVAAVRKVFIGLAPSGQAGMRQAVSSDAEVKAAKRIPRPGKPTRGGGCPP